MRARVCVSVEQSRGRLLVGSLLEEDALPFLHPRVVLHQLRVQKGVLWDAVLYPLHQAFLFFFLGGGGETQIRYIFQIPVADLQPQAIACLPIQGKKEME